MSIALKTVNEQYAEIHNADVDDITNLLRKRAPEKYYAEYADKRIAKQIELFLQGNHDPSGRFFVEAIHARPNIGGTDFTREELQRAANTLSFRPINIDHNPKYRQGKHLPFPANSTLCMTWDPALQAVTGLVQLEFRHAQLVREGRISGVSVEYFSLGGLDGKGIVFTALALVSSSRKPADKAARIYGGFQ